MKRILFLLVSFLALAAATFNASAAKVTMVKSYCQQQIGGGNQCPIASNCNVSEVITFFDDGTIKFRLGTVWKYSGTDAWGNRIYTFLCNEGIKMPGYGYQNVVIRADQQYVQMNYLFGFGMAVMPQYTLYRYLGEGENMANEWLNNEP